MTAIAFISSAWGPRFGGINEFNAELCRAVGRTRKDLRVYCFTFGITESDVRSALADGVELVNIGDDPGDRPLDNTVGYALVEHASKITDLEWWIGHDVISGRAAVVAGERSGVKVAVFQHTDYASYGSLKGTPGTVVLRRDQLESETLSRADVIVGVGPKLAAAALDRVRAGASGSQVTMLVPGLPELEPASSAPSTFRAITFGRLDPESDRIKLGRLAVRSFGELIKQVPEMVGRDPRITVVGLNSGRLDTEQTDLAKLAGQAAHRAVTVVGHPFTEDRDVLLHALINSSVSLMLSVHEGFGLTGWEAIAAEVPLVLSRNSGLFDLLTSISGRAVSCVWGVEIRGRSQPPFYAKKDVKSVVEALREIAWKPHEAKNKARELKAVLNHYDWSQAAGTSGRSRRPRRHRPIVAGPGPRTGCAGGRRSAVWSWSPQGSRSLRSPRWCGDNTTVGSPVGGDARGKPKLVHRATRPTRWGVGQDHPFLLRRRIVAAATILVRAPPV